MNEAVNDMFFRQVLGTPPIKNIKKNITLSHFCKNKKFEVEFVDMCVDKIERVFNVSVRKIKNKPLEEILKYIEMKKTRDSLYGRRF